MRKVEMNVYKINELNEKMRERVINDYRDLLVDFSCENLEGETLALLENKHNLEGFKVEFSLSYSQGDGVCFYNEDVNILSYTILKNRDYVKANAFEKYILDTYKEDERFNEILEYLNEDNGYFIAKYSTRYSHSNTCEIYNNSCDNSFLENLAEELKIYVYNPICMELERFGYDFLDVKDEEVIEFIEANEYEFFENGQVYIG